MKRRRLGWILAGLGVFRRLCRHRRSLARPGDRSVRALEAAHAQPGPRRGLRRAGAHRRLPCRRRVGHYTQQGGAARHREARRRPRRKRAAREAQARKGARPHHGAPWGFEGRVRARDSLGRRSVPGARTLSAELAPGGRQDDGDRRSPDDLRAPFRDINDLRKGDSITVELPYATFHYRVFTHEIVDNDDWSIIRDRGFDTLVLSACHPLYSAKQRWVVYSRLVRVEPAGGTPYAV